jgi:hypothetical protein
LSPNVNISARLEAATKQYGVTILISGEFVSKLSEEAKSMCRKIDRVTVKGSREPIDLYTVDIYSFPPSFGCTCDDPTHFLDADFATDYSIECIQEGRPKGKPAGTCSITEVVVLLSLSGWQMSLLTYRFS